MLRLVPGAMSSPEDPLGADGDDDAADLIIELPFLHGSQSRNLKGDGTCRIAVHGLPARPHAPLRREDNEREGGWKLEII